MSDSEDIVDRVDEGGDDLFGDGDEEIEELASQPENELSDDDLRERRSSSERARPVDRYGSEDEQRHSKRVIGSMTLLRHRTPRIKDGAIQQLKVPKFLKFMPTPYDQKTFEATDWDIENEKADNTQEVLRFYHDADTGEMKSNAVVYRWDDDSLTMSVGGQHFAMQKKMTATPAGKTYNELDDSHTYAAAAHLSSGLFLVVGHVSEEYTVALNKELQDEAQQKLAMRYREDQERNEASRIIKTTHDPELQRKQAELAEKESMRAQRRRENAAARMDGPTGRGGGGGRGGGLSIDDLEGPRAGGARGAGGRKRGAPGSGKARRRRDDYDTDDEQDAGARKEDYDLADDFIAPSDEEISEEEEEEEEDLLEDDEDERPRAKRQKTADDDGEDAEGDMDDDVPAHRDSAAARRGRRHVVDDDEE